MIKSINLLLLIGGMFLQAFVFMVVWNWIPSEIFNLQSLDYAEGFGILVFLSFFKNLSFSADEKDDEKELAKSVTGIIHWIFIFALAAIIQGFI